jgi:hypothetical protein
MAIKSIKRPVPAKRVRQSIKKATARKAKRPSLVKARSATVTHKKVARKTPRKTVKKLPLLLRPLKHLRSRGFVKLPKDRKKWIIPLAFALVFGAIGCYFLIFSKAATVLGNKYTSLNPVRIADTRPNSGQPYAGQTIQATKSLNIQISGKGGVPSSGVSAVVVNITAVTPTADTHLTVFDVNTGRAPVSTLSLKAGQITNSQTVAKLAVDGTISVYNAAGSTNIIVDVIGYYSGAGDSYVPVGPSRFVDTRAGSNLPYAGKTLASGSSLAIKLSGAKAGINGADYIYPGATAVVADVTVVNAKSNGHITMYPSGTAIPNTSNINFTPGNTTKEVHAKLGADGSVIIYNASPGAIDILIDIAGQYVPDSVTTSTPKELYSPSVPVRITDTRDNSGQPNAGKHLAAGGVLTVQTKFMRIPAGATGLAYSLTAFNTGNTYLTAYSSASPRPTATSVTVHNGQPSSSLVTTKLNADGSFNIYNLAGTTDVIVDVVGFYFNNAAKLSWYTNACKPGQIIYFANAPYYTTINKCYNNSNSTTDFPIACPAGYYVNRDGQCLDENGRTYNTSTLCRDQYLKLGATGVCVSYLQEALNGSSSSPKLTINGTFDANTESSVKYLKSSSGWGDADGVGVAGPDFSARMCAGSISINYCSSTPPPTTYTPAVDSTTSLLFKSSDGYIYKTTAFGAPVKLPVFGDHPTWGQNATKIFFTNYNGTPGIYSMAADGSAITKIYSGAVAHSIQSIKWSPTAQKLAFVLWNNTGDYNKDFSVVTINADGTGFTRIFDNPTGTIYSLQWSPDGKKLLFDSPGFNTITYSGLNIINADGTGSGFRTLPGQPNIGEYNAWSPDSTKVAFTRSDGTGAIRTINIDGTGEVTILPNAKTNHVTWSPDGTKIAFAATPASSTTGGAVYVVNKDGSGLQNIATFTEPTYGIAIQLNWSPDSQRLAAMVPTGAGPSSSLYTMFSDGSSLKKLAPTSSGAVRDIEWSVQ